MKNSYILVLRRKITHTLTICRQCFYFLELFFMTKHFPTASVIYWSVVIECKYHRCSKSQKGNKYQQNIIKKEEQNTNKTYYIFFS